MTPEAFGFTENGSFTLLNWSAAQHNELTDDEMQLIIECHERRVVIFEQLAVENDPPRQRQYAAEIEDLEFEMQGHWHFEPNRNKHTWWIKSPGCKCPPMDNAGGKGIARRYIAIECPLHALHGGI